jgi:NitT/TauT family transport system substrate-binding protein
MRSPRLLRVLIAVALGFALHACTPQSSSVAGGSPARVRVLLLPSLSSAPFFIAADGGYFAEQGLQVEFVKVTRSADALPALAQGELDVWTGSVSFALLNAVARDARIKLVSDKGFFSPAGCAYGALMVRRVLMETGMVSGPDGLKGRRVAVNPAASPGYFIEKFLERGGLSLSDIHVVDIPEGAVAADALRAGSIDAAFVLEPWVTRIQQAGTGMLFASAGDVVPNYQHMVNAYGPSLLVRDPDTGRRFMTAYLRAVQQYLEGKTARNIDIVARNTGLDSSLLQQACWPSVRRDGRIDEASLIDFERWGRQRGFLDRELLWGQIWDARFVDTASRPR